MSSGRRRLNALAGVLMYMYFYNKLKLTYKKFESLKMIHAILENMLT